MSLVAGLAIIIAVAKLLGALAARLGQPALFGEILTGIVLGPLVLGVLQPTPALGVLSEIAVIFIVLSAALEMDLRETARAFCGRSLVLPLLAFLVPFAAGTALGQLFELSWTASFTVALCASITALPVAARILDAFGLMGTQLARQVIAVAILDDIAAFLVFGILAAGGHNAASTVFAGIGKAAAFAAVIAACTWGLARLRERREMRERWLDAVSDSPERGLCLLLVASLAVGGLATFLGLHAVIGVLFGALLFREAAGEFHAFRRVRDTVALVSAALFSPVFFAELGLKLNLAQLPSLGFFAAVLMVAMGSKIFAGWLGGRLLGVRQPLALGVMLNARGVMGLALANLAYEAKLIEAEAFAALLLMALVTTVVTPLLFRLVVRQPAHDTEADPARQFS